MSEKEVDYNKQINRSFFIAFIFVIFIAMLGSCSNDNNNTSNISSDGQYEYQPDGSKRVRIMDENEYYNSSNYDNTGESYEQYKEDKEYINKMYEEAQKLKERGY